MKDGAVSRQFVTSEINQDILIAAVLLQSIKKRDRERIRLRTRA